jgi:hypothetical protein
VASVSAPVTLWLDTSISWNRVCRLDLECPETAMHEAGLHRLCCNATMVVVREHYAGRSLLYSVSVVNARAAQGFRVTLRPSRAAAAIICQVCEFDKTTASRQLWAKQA